MALGALTGYIPKGQIRVLTQPDEPVSACIPQRAVAREDFALSDSPKGGAGGRSVTAGQRVYMLAKCGDMAYVCAADKPGLDVLDAAQDCTGFVALDKLSAPASTTHLTAFVNKDKINPRSKPDNKSGEIIGRARTGDRLRVCDYGNEWTGVVLPDGKRGYLMTKYLDFE